MTSTDQASGQQSGRAHTHFPAAAPWSRYAPDGTCRTCSDQRTARLYSQRRAAALADINRSDLAALMSAIPEGR